MVVGRTDASRTRETPTDNRYDRILELVLDILTDALERRKAVAPVPVAASKEARLLYTISEAAAALGVSRSTAYELAASGGIPSVRLGRSVRVPVEGLRRWIVTSTTTSDTR
jgi:excisionase family DNA binding protein